MSRRFHILSGHFDSYEAAQIYCYDSETVNDPEQINLDQSNAGIDTDFVEIGFKHAMPAFLAAMFDAPTAAELANFIAPANTVITIDHAGLLGGDARLETTKTLQYLGLFHGLAE